MADNVSESADTDYSGHLIDTLYWIDSDEDMLKVPGGIPKNLPQYARYVELLKERGLKLPDGSDPE